MEASASRAADRHTITTAAATVIDLILFIADSPVSLVEPVPLGMPVFAANQWDESDKAENAPHERVRGCRQDDWRHDQVRGQENRVECRHEADSNASMALRLLSYRRSGRTSTLTKQRPPQRAGGYGTRADNVAAKAETLLSLPPSPSGPTFPRRPALEGRSGHLLPDSQRTDPLLSKIRPVS
jgi:hypothetical protein